jgi:hypothetical protein
LLRVSAKVIRLYVTQSEKYVFKKSFTQIFFCWEFVNSLKADLSREKRQKKMKARQVIAAINFFAIDDLFA